MDRALIIVTLGFALIFLIAYRGRRMSRAQLYEIVIALYTFSCCFTRMYLPVLKAVSETEGSFGASLSIQPFYILSIFLIWVIARDLRWRIRRPNIWLLFIFMGYAIYTLLNPYDVTRMQTVFAVIYLLSFAIFIYLFANSFSAKHVVNGVFMGLGLTVVLHFLLALLFPVLGMESAIKLYCEDASTRADDRAGAVGTMVHPNGLGTYASYYFCFFCACFITAYKRRPSAVLAVLAFLVIVLSASRSALAAAVFAVLMIAVFYIYRRYKLISPQSILKGIIPLGIIIALLLTGPLNFLFSDVENLDEMTTSRLMHYYCGYEIFEDHPLVGVGLNGHLNYLVENGSAMMFEQIFDAADIFQPEEFMFSHPIHNIWIILIDELGLIGFIPILGFVFWYIATFKRRTRNSENRYYNIINITGLGIVWCLIVQGSTDWNPLTPQSLNVSLMFIALSLNRHYAAEVHPEFESVEAAKRRQLAEQAEEEEQQEIPATLEPA
ncbi:MAG: O-antigen ligase family protein [Muribaculaceae bacterium]|nr:O-antigen ligase family protein [Muribaculaceae bacterium]